MTLRPAYPIVRMPEVAITDAAVSMVSNRRYVGSIASFTADRNYTLPAGTAGDFIEVFLTTGDDAFELILLGAPGVSINGGPAATEWSRLFIDNEFARFRCHATNDWRVEIDRRVPQSCVIASASNSSGSNWRTIAFDTVERDNASLADLANDRITVRRTSRYDLSLRWFSETTAALTVIALTKNGVSVGSPEHRIHLEVKAGQSGNSVNASGGSISLDEFALAAGDQIYGIVFSGINNLTANSTEFSRPRLALKEVFG